MKTRQTVLKFAAIVALLASVCNCSPDDSESQPAGPSTSATSGGGDAMTGSSSSGAPVECVGPDDCGGELHSRCAIATCREGRCEIAFASADPWPDDASPGDCLDYRCDGAGNVVITTNLSDVPGERECAVAACSPGPSFAPKADGSACVGGICKAGACIKLP
jgi:hypothetical protein